MSPPRNLLICTLVLGACAERTQPLSLEASDAGPSNFHDAAVQEAAGLLLVAEELRFVLIDIEDPRAPRVIENDRDGEDDEPLPLYSLAADPGGWIYAGRLGSIEIYRLNEAQLAYQANVRVEAEVKDLAIRGDRLYAALGDQGILIFDLTTRDAPREIGRIPAERSMNDVEMYDDDHVVTYDGEDPALQVYNVRDAAAPDRVLFWITDFVSSRSAALAVKDGIVALNAVFPRDGSGLWFWDLGDLREPRSFGFSTGINAPLAGHVSLYRNFGYFSGRDRGLIVLEATDYRNQRSNILRPGHVIETAVAGDYLFAGTAEMSLFVYGLGDRPEEPQQVAEIVLPVVPMKVLSITPER